MTEQAPSAAASAPLSETEDRQWAFLAHFGNFILLLPALIIYLVFKDRGTLVRQEGKEALNWTINITGIVIAINIVNTILGFIPIIGLIVVPVLSLAFWAVLIVNFIFAILAGVKVVGGGNYRYPMNIRWIK